MDDAARQASEKIGELCDLIDETLDLGILPQAGESFFEDVRESLVDVDSTIRAAGRATGNQQRALENWESGLQKWLDNLSADD
jgi:hypothetical protein